MSWVDFAWPMLAAATAMLGLIHLIAWLRQRRGPAHLALATAAFAIAVVALIELHLMRATSVREYGLLLRYAQLPVAIAIAALIVAVRLYFGVGRWWLAILAASMRLLCIVPNFLFGETLNFLRIDALATIDWFGAPVVMAVGPANPWVAFAQVANVVFLLFVVDALFDGLRRFEPARRPRLLVVMGGLIAFILLGAVIAVLVSTGVVRAPLQFVSTLIGVIAALSFEMSSGMLDAERLAVRLRDSEARGLDQLRELDLATEAAQLAPWKYDIGAGTIDLSPRGHALLDLAAAPGIRAELLQRVHVDDREQLCAALAGARAPGDGFETEFRVASLGAGDPGRWVSARGRVEREGGRDMLRGVAMDISARRRAELRVQEVEREGAQQRAELAHLSRVFILSELSSSLAHELNQPLSAILYNAQAGLRYIDRGEPDIRELREILADIVECDSRAGEVIRRLRAMLRKEEPQHVQLDVNDVVLDSLRLMRSDLINRGVRVLPLLARDLPVVHGDRIQLQQVLLNLVTNGCDAMAHLDASRELRISTEPVSDERVLVRVEDRGRGIDAADLERIFEPFVTTKPDGMGLGLSVCRTIIGAHGGRLWATRNSGDGATLNCELPARCSA